MQNVLLLLYIAKYYVRYNNIQLLPSFEVNIEGCCPSRKQPPL